MRATIHVNIDLNLKAAWVHAVSNPVMDSRYGNESNHIGFFDDFRSSISGCYVWGKYAGPMDLARRMEKKLTSLGYKVTKKINLEWKFTD